MHGQEGQGDSALGAGAHQGRAGPRIAECDDAVQVVQRNPAQLRFSL